MAANAEGNCNPALHIVSNGKEYVISGQTTQTLNDDAYKMSQLYPNIYTFMTVVPDQINALDLTTMDEMFYNCEELIIVPNFSNYNAKSAARMFAGCKNIKAPNENLSLTNIVDASYMFQGCTSLQKVPKMDTRNLQKANGMFEGCEKLQGRFPHILNIQSLTEIPMNMFKGTGITTVLFSGNISENIKEQLTSENLKGDDTLEIITNVIELNNLYKISSVIGTTTAATDAKYAANYYQTEIVTDMYHWFINMSNLTAVDMSYWNVESVTTCQGLFSTCSNLQVVDMSNCNFNKCTNGNQMFYSCTKLNNLKLGNMPVLTDCSYMFHNCSSLKELDFSKVNTSQVTNFSNMFMNCTNLKVINGILDMSTLRKIYYTNNTPNVNNICNSIFYNLNSECFSSIVIVNPFNAFWSYSMNFYSEGTPKMRFIFHFLPNHYQMKYIFMNYSTTTSFYHHANISLIPSNFEFYDCDTLTTMDEMFEGCAMLIGEVPFELDCKSLQSVPKNMFSNCQLSSARFINVPEALINDFTVANLNNSNGHLTHIYVNGMLIED